MKPVTDKLHIRNFRCIDSGVVWNRVFDEILLSINGEVGVALGIIRTQLGHEVGCSK